MSESNTSLTQLLRAKLAPSEHTLAMLALTNEQTLDLIESAGFDISEATCREVSALHALAPQLVDWDDLVAVTHNVYLSALQQVARWLSGWDTYYAKFLTNAEAELAQANQFKARLPKLPQAHQQYYWDALSGVQTLRRLRRLLAPQFQQLSCSLAALGAVLRTTPADAQLVTAAHALAVSAFEALKSLGDVLEDVAYGLERDSINARGYLVPDVTEGDDTSYLDDTATGASGSHSMGHSTGYRHDSDDDRCETPSYHPSVNPTTGLPMVGDSYVDVGGNAFGTGNYWEP